MTTYSITYTVNIRHNYYKLEKVTKMRNGVAIETIANNKDFVSFMVNCNDGFEKFLNRVLNVVAIMFGDLTANALNVDIENINISYEYTPL